MNTGYVPDTDWSKLTSFTNDAQNGMTDAKLGGLGHITLLARLHKDQVKRVCKVLRDAASLLVSWQSKM